MIRLERSHGERRHATARCRRTSSPRSHTPSSLQTLRCTRSHLLRSKDARKPRRLSCCKATGGRVHRRGVLLGLGGAATAAGLAPTTTHGGGALAAPVQAPDLQSCHPPEDLPDTAADVSCCLTYRPGAAIVDFTPPPASSPLCVRPAAHLVDEEYLAKYERAVALMKALPDDDPRSFAQQWRVHCAYCNGAYDQVGFPGLDLQIHNCWLFFPWHRYTVLARIHCAYMLDDDLTKRTTGRMQVLPLLPREDPRQAHRRRHVRAAVLELGRARRHDAAGDLRRSVLAAVRREAQPCSPATVHAGP